MTTGLAIYIFAHRLPLSLSPLHVTLWDADSGRIGLCVSLSLLVWVSQQCTVLSTIGPVTVILQCLICQTKPVMRKLFVKFA